MTTFVDCNGYDIFESATDALVNPVNCRGAMGAGLAKAFKNRYPDMYEEYRKVCDARQLSPGEIFHWKGYDVDGTPLTPWILNVATKDHWRDKSKLAWVEEGVCRVKKLVVDLNLRSVAMPKLGCGHGGLSWQKVEPMIKWHLEDMGNLVVEMY